GRGGGGEKAGTAPRSAGGASPPPQGGPAAPPPGATPPKSQREEAGNRRHRPLHVRVAVRGRDEHRLELGRRDVDALLEQAPEERAVPVGVALLRLGEARHRPPVRHEQREHRTDALHPTERREPLLELAADRLQPLVYGL